MKENEKKDNDFDLARKLKNLWHIKVTVIPIVIGALSTVTKSLLKGLGNKRTSGDHPDNSIVEIGQNTEKSLGFVSQTPVKDIK